MDIATPIGIVAGAAVVAMAILLGGSASTFIDIPSVFIVIGGTIAATIIRFTFATVMVSLKIGLQIALNLNKTEPKDLIDEALELTNIYRQKGPLALENVQVRNEVLQKGVLLVVDGLQEDVIRKVLHGERDRTVERMEDGVKVFRAIGDAAPAFGMIGTLVGLVQMLATMDDPSTIGPAMAVALLTTLYGALVANLIALPIADKLEGKIAAEYLNRSLVIDIVLGIAKGSNPDMLRDQLEVYLPPTERTRGESEPAAA